ncbi:MAG: histidine kinase, partial [Clostridia bacterium]|nr:histidine kinase [Clostridia bacterium]
LLILTVLGIRSTSRWMHAPINRLVKDIRHVSEGPGSVRLRDSMASEITEISRSVNLMLDELEDRNEELLRTQANVRELQLLHKDTQLRALQAQINPHFLYNTLECVRSIAFAYRVEEISDILDSIIQIYRYSASDVTEGTVRSEFDCCESYANVIGYRFGSKYQIEMSVEPGVEDTPIPRMAMQPLLENAINHGYAKTDRGGTVRITARRSGDGAVLIRVRDDGCGISPQALAELREQIGNMEHQEEAGPIGLRNVHRRLRRSYGEGFGLELESAEGVYTEVTLRIPERRREEQA